MLERAGARSARVVQRLGWPRIRICLAAVYFAVLGYRIFSGGVPTNRRSLALVVVLGLAVWCVGRGWRRLLQVVLDWLPFTVLLMLYDSSRAVAGRMGMPLHEADVAHAEQWLFGGTLPTLWLQHRLYDPAHVHWYDALASVVYISHFVVTPVLAAILWMRSRPEFWRFAARVILLSFAGLATYILFPEAPPWMAGRDGYLPPVARLSARGWTYLHAGFADRLLVEGQTSGSNPVAAMPSLHLAFAMLAALFIAQRWRSRWRFLLYLYPLAMGASLVYTGEHYVIDLVFGALYAVVAHRALTVLEERWRARTRLQRAEDPRAAPEDSTGAEPGPAADRLPDGPGEQPVKVVTTER